MNLEYEQMEDIIALKDSSAYKNVTDLIKAEIDFTAQDMQTLDSNLDVKLLPYWKALNKVYFLLSTAPESIREELENYRKNIIGVNAMDSFMHKPTPELLTALKKHYETLKKQEKE